MIKKIVCIILAIALNLTFCGCANNYDLVSIAIVAGIGFDKAADGQIEVTVEVLSPNQGGETGETGGGGSSRSSIVYTVEGPTFFDALRNFVAKTSKRLYWNDVQLVVIGEQYAKGGITDILDCFQRDDQANLRSDVVIAKGLTAKEVLESTPNIATITAVQIDDSLKNVINLGKNCDCTLFDIVKQNASLKPCIVIGTIEKDNVQNNISTASSSGTSGNLDLINLVVQGSAILKNYKLVGYLTPDQTRGFLFAQNKIASTIIVVKNPVDNKKLISIKIIKSNGEIKTEISDNKPELSILVNAQGTIGDQQGTGDLTTFKNVDLLTSEIDEEIKAEIESAAFVSQKEYQSDIFCFNQNIYENNNAAWKKLMPNWDSIYSKSEINIEVNFLIKRSGMINKPLA